MPTLKIDTNNATPAVQEARNASSTSRPTSPIPPPISPITPVLSHASLAPGTSSGSGSTAAPATMTKRGSMTEQSPRGTTVSSPNANFQASSNQPQAQAAPSQQNQPPHPQFTHSQPPQTFIPQPELPRETISFSSNPDALALQSAISLLQMQRMRATQDIETLQAIKQRALADPEEFARALIAGEVSSAPTSKAGGITDAVVGIRSAGDDGEGEEEDDSDDSEEDEDEEMDDAGTSKRWPTIPAPQNVIRTPPVNWGQYAVVGDALDKMHADQVARPMEGVPAVARVDGSGRLIVDDGRAGPPPILPGGIVGGGQREAVIAAPYTPGKDRIEKPASATKKGGKK